MLTVTMTPTNADAPAGESAGAWTTRDAASAAPTSVHASSTTQQPALDANAMRMDCVLTYVGLSGRSWTVPWTTEIEPPRTVTKFDEELTLMLRVVHHPAPLDTARAA